MKRQILLFIIIIFHFKVFQLYSQLNCGGSPLSFREQLKSSLEIPLYNLPEFNNEALVNEDNESDLVYQCESRIAKGFRVDISPGNYGLWEILPDGGKLWRMRILSKGAGAIHIMFDQFILPEGAELFLYNNDKSQILGAFGWENNQTSGILAIAPIRGEEIMIEYFEPADVSFNGILHIGNIGHNYRYNSLTDADGFGDSEVCNKDVNCEAAADWQLQKRSVCMIVFQKSNGDYYLCSGALINNAKNNGIPYLLTANHCLPTYYEAQTAIYYFNYESPFCNGPDGDLSQTISGSTIRATTYQLDFCLVELSSAPPPSYKPYYSGWDITTEAPKKSVCIHHPLGDVKKIAFYNAVAITGDFIYLYDYNDNTHWYIEDWHYGITQGGASGSPLYNQDHRIVGDLTGGSTGGNCTSSDAFFAKICHSWADYTSLTRLQLKPWLDPDNTGVTFLDGYEPASTLVENINSNYGYVRVYPNPSDGIVSIEFQHQFTSPVALKIMNLTGRILLTGTVSSMERTNRLDLSGYSPGIYLLELQSAGFMTTRKIILE